MSENMTNEINMDSIDSIELNENVNGMEEEKQYIVVNIGDEIEVLIKRFTPQEHRIGLSLKDVELAKRGEYVFRSYVPKTRERNENKMVLTDINRIKTDNTYPLISRLCRERGVVSHASDEPARHIEDTSELRALCVKHQIKPLYLAFGNAVALHQGVYVKLIAHL